MNYTEVFQQLLEYYANLLIVQYNGKTRAVATIQMLVNLILANLLVMQIRDAFDYRTAVVQNAYNFTVVGSPTITADGIASGFSDSNYITATKNIDFTKSFVVEGEFATGSNITQQQFIFATTINYAFGLQVFDDRYLYAYYPTTENRFKKTILLSANTKYKYRYYYTGTELKLDINDETYTISTSDFNPTIASFINIGIGRTASQPFNGSIDLNAFKVYVDGVEVYKAWQPPAINYRTAVGNQLDIIGKWVGVTRSYNGNLFWAQPIFSYPESQELVPEDLTTPFQHGYSKYSTFDTDVTTGDIAELTYHNVGYVEQKLSDDNYRTVIGLKIIKNSINHTQKNIDDAIWDYFNGQVYTTWKPHKITYNYPPDLETVMEVCFYKNVLPAPTGVAIELKVVS